MGARPTTRKGEWGRANGVELDRLDASRERARGAEAVGTGVPALSREDLSVFTAQQWEGQKDRMIYEAWLKAARAQLKPDSK